MLIAWLQHSPVRPSAPSKQRHELRRAAPSSFARTSVPLPPAPAIPASAESYLDTMPSELLWRMQQEAHQERSQQSQLRDPAKDFPRRSREPQLRQREPPAVHQVHRCACEPAARLPSCVVIQSSTLAGRWLAGKGMLWTTSLIPSTTWKQAAVSRATYQIAGPGTRIHASSASVAERLDVCKQLTAAATRLALSPQRLSGRRIAPQGTLTAGTPSRRIQV